MIRNGLFCFLPLTTYALRGKNTLCYEFLYYLKVWNTDPPTSRPEGSILERSDQ